MWKKLLKEKREEFEEWYGRFKRHENFLLREFVIMPGDQDDWREDVPSDILFEMHQVYSEFCDVHGSEYMEMLQHVSFTRTQQANCQAQNEAAGTYASLHLSAPPSEYDTLNIKRDTGFVLKDCQQTMVSFLIILTLILGLYALTVGLGLDCQKATVSLLIILTLIVVLYALTVGLGLYKMRQLSTKLKAQNEAADTYASLHLSAPPSEYDTLNIKRGDTQ
ncbi:sialic acid-binding Ig-like lectin 7 isoform X1 [Labeo rohita]|uniref:Sialic acid-binding Ig-like lectin 7 isoform X1 n=1 Tax=Labeo rohita TaxID=84645 RepID=A0A498MEL5_LABRO|nr:sialic acid-binding Ig-like lectin 7 isoform X1 [Labeo rohita]